MRPPMGQNIASQRLERYHSFCQGRLSHLTKRPSIRIDRILIFRNSQEIPNRQK